MASHCNHRTVVRLGLWLVVLMVAPQPIVIAQGATGTVKRLVEEVMERFSKVAAQEAANRSSRSAIEGVVGRAVGKWSEIGVQLVRDLDPRVLKQLSSFGDDVLEVFIKASPVARKSALRLTKELASAMKSYGVDALELEAKAPGLAAEVFKTFDADAARYVAREVRREEIPRLLGYAGKADSPETVKLLISKYKARGSALFEQIPAITLAGGLTASMLLLADSATGPVEAVERAIDRDPGVVGRLTNWTGAAILAGVVGSVLIMWRTRRPRRAA